MDYHKLKHQGFMFVISSPSGVGKTTICKMLLAAEETVEMSVSATTRPMRPKEHDGLDYHFISHERFEDMVKKNEFLEHAKVFGQNYGTPKAQVFDMLDQGKDVLFDIDWQGARTLKKKYGDKVVSVFMLPPDIAELERRLNFRAQDSKDIIHDRMIRSSEEIKHWEEYDYVIINNDLEETVGRILFILHGERAKRIRSVGLNDFVHVLLKQHQEIANQR